MNLKNPFKRKKLARNKVKTFEEKRAKEISQEEYMYNSWNPFIRIFHRSRIKKVIEVINKDSYTSKISFKILDVGCGEGFILNQIKGKKYGIDISETRVNIAKEKLPEAHIRHSDGVNFEFDDNTFDIVICLEVLEHTPNYKKMIDEMNRVAKKGGKLIISVPHERNLGIIRAVICRFPYHPHNHINDFSIKDMNILFGKNPKQVYKIPKLFNITRIFIYTKE